MFAEDTSSCTEQTEPGRESAAKKRCFTVIITLVPVSNTMVKAASEQIKKKWQANNSASEKLLVRNEAVRRME